MAEDLQEKMDRYNEMLLKSTALTFSSEGISRDIKGLISKKAEFVAEMLTGLASLIQSSSGPRTSAARVKVFDEMLVHALNEVRTVNSTMNYLIAKQFEKEASIVAPDSRKPQESPAAEKRVKGRNPRK